MKIHNVVGNFVQVGETITNTQPLIVDVRGVREQLTDAVAHDAVAAETAEALGDALDDAEQELAEPAPRRGRLREIVAGITALTGGVTASTGLIESVEALTRTVTGAQ
jgi:hypothetical protein